eukprot:377605-Rhodomonas_salina.7
MPGTDAASSARLLPGVMKVLSTSSGVGTTEVNYCTRALWPVLDPQSPGVPETRGLLGTTATLNSTTVVEGVLCHAHSRAAALSVEVEDCECVSGYGEDPTNGLCGQCGRGTYKPAQRNVACT